MNKQQAKKAGLKRRERRVRAKIICSASTLDPEFRATGKIGSNKEAAEFVGELMGKSAEVPLAIQKGIEDAKKNMFHVPVTEHGTIPHTVEGHYGAGRVLTEQAAERRGMTVGEMFVGKEN